MTPKWLNNRMAYFSTWFIPNDLMRFANDKNDLKKEVHFWAVDHCELWIVNWVMGDGRWESPWRERERERGLFCLFLSSAVCSLARPPYPALVSPISLSLFCWRTSATETNHPSYHLSLSLYLFAKLFNNFLISYLRNILLVVFRVENFYSNKSWKVLVQPDKNNPPSWMCSVMNSKWKWYGLWIGGRHSFSTNNSSQDASNFIYSSSF